MAKSTAKLLEELKSFSDFKRFFEENENDLQTICLKDALNACITEQGLNKAQVIQKSQLSEVYAYQIFSGTRCKPDRKKVLALAFGMELDVEKTQQLLKSTGYAPLYAKNAFDCIVIYALLKHYSLIKTNEMLYDYGQETIG